MRTVVGLDVGGTKTHGVLVGPDATVLEQVRLPTIAGPDGILETISSAIDLLAPGSDRASVAAVGVGVPGIVDHERGRVRNAVNLGIGAEWFTIGDQLEDQCRIPVLVENDVNAAAVGTAALSGIDDLVYLSVGTGLAAGIVLTGVLRRGVCGAAGEIGHIPFGSGGAPCRCGQRGCLETSASGRALSLAYGRSARSLLAAARDGDKRAARTWTEFVAAVAVAVTAVCLTVDPRAIFLGGGVAEVGRHLLDSLIDHLAEQAIGSDLMRSLDLAARVRAVPADAAVSPLGAALGAIR